MAVCFTVFGKSFSTTASKCKKVFQHVTVIGGGLMGSGIAQVTAESGMDVTIVEVNEEAVNKSDANIKNSMQRVAKKLFQNSSADAEKYISESMGRLKISTDLNEAVGKSDLVVEAIVENLDAKHKLFSKIDRIAPDHTIFASNTSSLNISDIAAITDRKDRFGGLHFFNPVPVMKLLEVVRTKDTSDETYKKLLAWGKAIGKTTITCRDTPGFVVNRLLVPYLIEAVRMLERGDASAKDIDLAMKLGAGYPMGPLELLDYVGLDTTKFILSGWHKKYPENPLFFPVAILDKLVSEGKLGKKTGEGFYSYKKSTGPVSFALHSPYFQSLPSSTSRSGSNFSQKTFQKDDFGGTKNWRKTKTSGLDQSHRMAKLERLEKLKKLEKSKSAETSEKAEPEGVDDSPKGSTPGEKVNQLTRYIVPEVIKASLQHKNVRSLVKLNPKKIFEISSSYC